MSSVLASVFRVAKRGRRQARQSSEGGRMVLGAWFGHGLTSLTLGTIQIPLLSGTCPCSPCLPGEPGASPNLWDARSAKTYSNTHVHTCTHTHASAFSAVGRLAHSSKHKAFLHTFRFIFACPKQTVPLQRARCNMRCSKADISAIHGSAVRERLVPFGRGCNVWLLFPFFCYILPLPCREPSQRPVMAPRLCTSHPGGRAKWPPDEWR